MRRYETIYILRPTMNEDEINETVENTNAVLGTDGGQVISLNKWGVKTLAYEIKKETQGYYIYCDYATNPANVTEMERKFRIDDSVMKYMTVKLADAIDEEGIAVARNEYEAAVVAAARAEEEAKQEESAPESTEKPKEAAPESAEKPKEATPESTEKPKEAAPTEAAE